MLLVRGLQDRLEPQAARARLVLRGHQGAMVGRVRLGQKVL